MTQNIQTIFGLVGGLAIFLYGMNAMSDALQKAAGERMRKILGFLTQTPLSGALAGLLVTAVLQSSSATTVMVIGFVSAGLMTLPQAISVIFGANIGTTMTAQLIAFKLDEYIYPIIFVGFLIQFLSKKEQIKSIGTVVLSFGLLFLGIQIMGDVMKPLASSPVFIDMMEKVKGTPVLGVLVGLVMTLVVQSSSATIAVLQSFAAQPIAPDSTQSVIGLAGAIPILFGDNIGTTITALLASIGQSRNAKRAAIAHCIFNVTGTIFFLFFIPVLVQFVEFISPTGPEIRVISRQIANAHTTFNVTCTLIWLPLIAVMVKIVTFLVRGKDAIDLDEAHPKFLDDKVIPQPIPALYLASQELRRVSELTLSLFRQLTSLAIEKELSSKENEFDRNAKAIHCVQRQTSVYLTKLLAGGHLTGSQTESAAGLLFVSNRIDHLVEQCILFREKLTEYHTQGIYFSEEATKGLADLIHSVQTLFVGSIANLEGSRTHTTEASREELRQQQKALTRAHLLRVRQGVCPADHSKPYVRLLDHLELAAGNCAAIADVANEEISFIDLKKELHITPTTEGGGHDIA